MGFNFPNSPTEGAVYTAASGQQYTFSNGVWLQTGFAYTPLLTAQPYSRIVNGAMQISQENGNTAGTADNYYPADQWRQGYGGGGVLSAQRVQVVTPNGSVNRLRFGVSTADTSIAAGDHYEISYYIEGVRTADFRWGSASAKQVILRFGWKGPAGTYSVRLSNSGFTRSYIANFTISAGQANTDTEQVFVVPGDTTGTWLTDTGIGIVLTIALAMGTTWQGAAGWQAGNFYATAAITNNMVSLTNVFELTDVGLYLDPNATGKAPPWQMPDYAEEEQACMRYYQTQANCTVFASYMTGASWTTNMTFPFKQIMRGTPAIATSNISYGSASTLTPNSANPSKTNFSITATAAGQSFCTFDYVANARM